MQPIVTAKCEIIESWKDFERLKNYVERLKPEYTTLDVETDGLIEKQAKLYGIALAFNEDYAFYIVWRNKNQVNIWNKTQEQEITDWLYKTCSNSKMLCHNGIFDILILYNNLNIDLTDCLYSDTILQKHTLSEEKPFSLKDIAVLYLGPGADKAKETLLENIRANGGKTTKDNMEMYKADTNVLGEYACWDVQLTLKLFNLFEKRLKEENLYDFFYKDEVIPLYKLVTIPMRKYGFPVDVPYFKQLNEDISKEINKLEEEIMEEIQPYVGKFAKNVLDEEVPINNKGNFPKALAEVLEIPLPITKEGNVTLSKKAIGLQKAANPSGSAFYDWIVEGGPLPNKIDSKAVSAAQRALFFKGTDQKYVFNLNSGDHLRYLMFDCFHYKPLEMTAGGEKSDPKPKVDIDFFDNIKASNPIVAKLIDFKKLQKLKSTYIEGILSRQLDGIIYTNMLQQGTTSGRYSSQNPNLQNQPRVKEDDSGLSELVLSYVNAIRKGFIAGPDKKLVGDDFEQLEPSCFAHMSGSEELREVFRKGEDLYSRVAIDVNSLNKTYSADKKADNYLKKFEPEMRQLWKVPTLGIVYGMGEARLQEAIGCEYKEATSIINGYLNRYPDLKNYMNKCDYEAKKFGFVKSSYGRVRHLPEAKRIYERYGNDILDYKFAKAKGLTEERRMFKNFLNNAKNFKIQSLAATIVNRSAIAIAKEFKLKKIDGYAGLQVHDELIYIVKKEQAEDAAKIIQWCMENTIKLSIPLKAKPTIADNWKDTK